MTDVFRTLSSPGKSSLREFGSKFLGFSFPVKNQDDIRRHLDDLRQAFPDASHHCHAWMLGISGALFRAWDDGEPNHSAGDPILGQIRSFGLTDVLVVVVRWFGGTKLGVSGLIQAYRQAAREALESATIAEVLVTERWKLEFPYSTLPIVMKAVKAAKSQTISLTTAEPCVLVLEVPVRAQFHLHLEQWQQSGVPVTFEVL